MNTHQTSLLKDSHCSYCGSRFTEQNIYPRKCFVCYNDTWKNPIPVVVMLIPIWGNGYLIQQRNIEPEKGGWAFCGGYIDAGEEWNEAAARELKEEMGLQAKPDEFRVVDVRNDTSGHMIIFCAHDGFTLSELQSSFIPNEEVAGYNFIYEESLDKVKLCFPLHQEMFLEWLAKQ